MEWVSLDQNCSIVLWVKITYLNFISHVNKNIQNEYTDLKDIIWLNSDV